MRCKGLYNEGAPDPAVVEEAARRLRRGEVLVVPTDTVYGLAALMRDKQAVERLYEIKSRARGKPLAVQVHSSKAAEPLAACWDERWEALAAAWWPGPLTLIGLKSSLVPDWITGGADTVGIRIPDEEGLLAVMRLLDQPLAVTSANMAGESDQVTAAAARASLGAGPTMVLDGGPSKIGTASTVIDLSGENIRILRSGSASPEEIAEVLFGCKRGL